eukprot:TRINITY_DN2109_c0_g5_i1.p1 TRINITY_DN2109_c0_g5~~TRINITY_DN2109_c0_g5_i1.p1  ORF type:complete len:453 (-),score=-22.25 TRINITY_DN2109_c0_g5_i1:63-1421(-)
MCIRDRIIFIKHSIQIFIPFALDESQLVLSLFFLGNNGHRDKVGAAGFAISLMQMIGFSLAYGIAAGLESMSAVAYGSKNFQLLGLYFNKTIIVQLIFAAFSITLYLTACYWLPMLPVNQEIVSDTVFFLRWITPSLLAFGYQETLRSQLHAMNIFHIQVYIGLFGFFTKVVLLYVLLDILKMGLLGLIIIKNVTECLICILLYITSYKKKFLERFKKPFDKSTLKNWSQFSKKLFMLSFPMFLGWANWSMNTIQAGFLKDIDEINAQSIMTSILGVVTCLRFSLQILTNTVVGNAVGEFNKQKVLRLVKIASTCLVILVLGQVLFYMLLTPYFSQVFMGNDSVKAALLRILPVFQLQLAIETSNALLCGCLRSLNLQKYMLLAIFIDFVVRQVTVYYFVQIVDWGLKGVWLGLLCGTFICSSMNLIILLTSSIDKQIEIAKRNLVADCKDN